MLGDVLVGIAYCGDHAWNMETKALRASLLSYFLFSLEQNNLKDCCVCVCVCCVCVCVLCVCVCVCCVCVCVCVSYV